MSLVVLLFSTAIRRFADPGRTGLGTCARTQAPVNSMVLSTRDSTVFAPVCLWPIWIFGRDHLESDDAALEHVSHSIVGNRPAESSMWLIEPSWVALALTLAVKAEEGRCVEGRGPLRAFLQSHEVESYIHEVLSFSRALVPVVCSW